MDQDHGCWFQDLGHPRLGLHAATSNDTCLMVWHSSWNNNDSASPQFEMLNDCFLPTEKSHHTNNRSKPSDDFDPRSST